MDHAEHRGVRANSERERHDGNDDEAGIPPHVARRVLQILPQLREVLARPDSQQIHNRLCPDARARDRPNCIAMLIAKHLLHFVPVVGAEIERQEPQQASIETVHGHVRRVLGIRLFARAIPKAVSIRRASAWATPRPKSVSR